MNKKLFMFVASAAMLTSLVSCGGVKLVAPVLSSNGGVVTWEAVKNAESYNVYVGEELVANVTETTYTLPMNETNAAKLVTVEAVKGEKVSEKSEAVSVQYTAGTAVAWDGTLINSSWAKTGAVKVATGMDLQTGGVVRTYTKIPSGAKYLKIAAGSLSSAVSPEMEVKVNGTIVKAKTYTTDVVALPAAVDTLYGYVYDITTFANTNAVISISQKKTTATHMILNGVMVTDSKLGLSDEYDYWEGKNDILDAWALAGNYRDGVDEGFDINSFDNGIVSSISKVVSVTEEKPIFAVKYRMFNGQDGAGTTEDPYRTGKLGFRVNGTLVRAMNSDEDYATLIGNQDGSIVKYYDLSAYAGSTVSVAVASEQGGTVGHCVIQKLSFEATTSYGKYYNKNAIKEGWNLVGDFRDDTGEGYDLNAYDSSSVVSVNKIFKVTADKCYMGLSMREFSGGDGQKEPVITVTANGTDLVAVGDTDAQFTIINTSDIASFTNKFYDLSAYVGQTICLEIAQHNTTCGHAVIRGIGFTGVSTEASYAREADVEAGIAEMGESWGAAGIMDVYNEGINIDSWDGYGALFNVLMLGTNAGTLEVNLRTFAGQDDEGEGVLTVLINGVVVAEKTGKTTIENTIDDDQFFNYDISSYAGTPVSVVLLVNGRARKCCFQTIKVLDQVE